MSGYYVDFQAPSQAGVNFADPDEVADYFSSMAMSVSRALQELQRQMNNPRHIMVPTGQGRKPLAATGTTSNWQPGDVKLTWAGQRGGSGDNPGLPSNSVLKLQGWVVCNGKNGTKDMTGAFALGSTSQPAVEAGSTSDITSGAPSSLVNVMRTCDTQAQAGDDTHTHDSDIDGSVKTVTFVFLMRV